MSKHLNELKEIVKQYEEDSNIGRLSKELLSISSLIDIEAEYESELPISPSYFEDSIISEFFNRNDNKNFVGTGLTAFDRINGEFKGGEFFILVGLESMGKTTLMIEIANHWAANGKKVGFLNLEESTKQITKKFLANIGRLSPAFFNKEWGSKEANLKLVNAAKILKANPIYLYDNPNLDLNKLIIQIRKLVSESKVEIVFIDYLELIIVGELNNKTDTNRTIICNNLKRLAIQLNIVLIVGSQLPRNSYASSINNNRPKYCDLVAKGFIEPNTDTVLVHRSDYFGNEVDENNQPTKNRMELVIAKYSTGTFLDVPVKTSFDKSAIMDIDYSEI